MRQSAVLLVIALGLVINNLRSSGQSIQKPPAPADKDAEAGRIAELVKQLGHDNFAEREAAHHALVKVGSPALDALRLAAGGSKDLEVRKRAESLARLIQDRLDRADITGEPAPPGAVVLFAGKGLDAWIRRDGQAGEMWKIVDGGALEVNGPDIMTHRVFAGPYRLHVEFRVPPGGNSGVYLQGLYEVQILDSRGAPLDIRGCGAIYGVAAPRVNASKAPGVWQSFDIELYPPEYLNGRKLRHARITVSHNGVKVQDATEVERSTDQALPCDPAVPGPILLQGHGDPVQFRNIWLLPIRR
jgi:hypothetical protein